MMVNEFYARLSNGILRLTCSSVDIAVVGSNSRI